MRLVNIRVFWSLFTYLLLPIYISIWFFLRFNKICLTILVNIFILHYGFISLSSNLLNYLFIKSQDHDRYHFINLFYITAFFEFIRILRLSRNEEIYILEFKCYIIYYYQVFKIIQKQNYKDDSSSSSPTRFPWILVNFLCLAEAIFSLCLLLVCLLRFDQDGYLSLHPSTGQTCVNSPVCKRSWICQTHFLH